MELNIPANIRSWLYVAIVLGGPVVFYLMTKGWIGDAELALWTAITMGVAALARLNVTPDVPGDRA